METNPLKERSVNEEVVRRPRGRGDAARPGGDPGPPHPDRVSEDGAVGLRPRGREVARRRDERWGNASGARLDLGSLPGAENGLPIGESDFVAARGGEFLGLRPGGRFY